MLLSIYDPLNLRDSITSITNFLKEANASEAAPKNILHCLQVLLKGICFEERDFDGVILMIQKVFSGNISESKIDFVARKVLSGEADHTLRENIACITKEILACPRSRMLFEQLYRQVSPRFFEETDISRIEKEFEQKDYTGFLLSIIRHGFSVLYNLPAIFATRIYQEALTYDYNSPLRFELMRVAGEMGNKNAALEYGNYIARDGSYGKAFEYLMLAVPLPAAVWNLAYLIEMRYVGTEQIRQFKEALKLDEKLASKDFSERIWELDMVSCRETDLEQYDMCVYKAYFLLAYSGFFKAFNSMAKLLGAKRIVAKSPDRTDSIQVLIDKYYRLAISGSNVMAMNNRSRFLLNKYTADELSNSEADYMLELIRVSKDMNFARAHYYHGLYLEHNAQDADDVLARKQEIISSYKQALDLGLGGTDVRGDTCYRLGQLVTDVTKKQMYFQKAIENGAYDAAYYLALLSFEEYTTSKKNEHLLKAKKILDENVLFISGKVKNGVKILYEEIGNILEPEAKEQGDQNDNDKPKIEPSIGSKEIHEMLLRPLLGLRPQESIPEILQWLDKNSGNFSAEELSSYTHSVEAFRNEDRLQEQYRQMLTDFAYRHWEQLSLEGHAQAQYYYSGHLEQNRQVETALSWLQKSAEGGYKEAQRKLGEIYSDTGMAKKFGVAPDVQAAEKWYLLAAEQGDKRSALSLGYMYDQYRNRYKMSFKGTHEIDTYESLWRNMVNFHLFSKTILVPDDRKAEHYYRRVAQDGFRQPLSSFLEHKDDL